MVSKQLCCSARKLKQGQMARLVDAETRPISSLIHPREGETQLHGGESSMGAQWRILGPRSPPLSENFIHWELPQVDQILKRRMHPLRPLPWGRPQWRCPLQNKTVGPPQEKRGAVPVPSDSAARPSADLASSSRVIS